MLRIPARNVYPRQARPALYIHNYYGTPTPLPCSASLLVYLLRSQAEAEAAFMILFYL